MAISAFPKPEAYDNRTARVLTWDDLRDKTGRALKHIRFIRGWGCYNPGECAGPPPEIVQKLIDDGIAEPVYKATQQEGEASGGTAISAAPAPVHPAPLPPDPVSEPKAAPASQQAETEKQQPRKRGRGR